MKYHFKPAELREGVDPGRSALDWLSCKRIELDGDSSAVTVETGREEIVLVCIDDQMDYEFQGATGTAAFVTGRSKPDSVCGRATVGRFVIRRWTAPAWPPRSFR